MYFIILNRTHREDTWITLSAGVGKYTYITNHAKMYVEGHRGPLVNEHEKVLKITAEQLETLAIKSSLEGDTYRMPNCKAVWDELGLIMTPHGLDDRVSYSSPIPLSIEGTPFRFKEQEFPSVEYLRPTTITKLHSKK